jgi:hypothetical protein
MGLAFVGQLACHLLAEGVDILICHVKVNAGPQPTELHYLAGWIEAVLVFLNYGITVLQ